mmetsp:Transcript_15375/g.53608  ORF Transcript_15375/g.53608 Transcript_15375/m.53608 type:complete len:288 (+) Transcript_15375:912-1775(+)
MASPWATSAFSAATRRAAASFALRFARPRCSSNCALKSSCSASSRATASAYSVCRSPNLCSATLTARIFDSTKASEAPSFTSVLRSCAVSRTSACLTEEAPPRSDSSVASRWLYRTTSTKAARVAASPIFSSSAMLRSFPASCNSTCCASRRARRASSATAPRAASCVSRSSSCRLRVASCLRAFSSAFSSTRSRRARSAVTSAPSSARSPWSCSAADVRAARSFVDWASAFTAVRRALCSSRSSSVTFADSAATRFDSRCTTSMCPPYWSCSGVPWASWKAHSAGA